MKGKAAKVCQNNLRPAAKVTDGTRNALMVGERL